MISMSRTAEGPIKLLSIFVEQASGQQAVARQGRSVTIVG